MEDSLQQEEQSLNNNIKGCILPWIHLHGDIRGDYALCCHTDSHHTMIRTGYSTDSPIQVWNNSAMKSARRKFLQGDYPEECSVCYDKEKVNVTSHRMIMNREYRHFKKLQDLTDDDGSIKNPPIYLDFRFGNTCNFRCRMCGTDASTSWFKERHLAYGANTNKASVDKWTNNEVFWSDFEKLIPNIEVMYFAGGEPFVQEGHYKALQLLIKHKKTDITLQYNTNLSYKKFKKYDIKELWSYFKRVQLWPSVDGFGKKAEYGRKGLVWDTFTENLKHFRQYITSVSIVSNIYSISSMTDLIKYLKKQKIDYHITNLTFPNILSTKIIPVKSKKEILKDFRALVESGILTHYEIDNMKDTLSFMVSKDESYLLSQFKKYNLALDESRSEKFEQIYPEFAEWYKNILV